jgi:hypothetical protein
MKAILFDLGKPAQSFYETGLAMLGAAPADTLMIGDDIRGDVGRARIPSHRAARHFPLCPGHRESGVSRVPS